LRIERRSSFGDQYRRGELVHCSAAREQKSKAPLAVLPLSTKSLCQNDSRENDAARDEPADDRGAHLS
jgi:hypothetical protein